MTQLPIQSNMVSNTQIKSNMIFEIPQSEHSTFDLALLQLKYKNNKQYYLKFLKNFTPNPLFEFTKDAEIILKSMHSDKLIWLFIIFFCYNSYKPQNAHMLTTFKKFVYKNSLQIPRDFHIENKFWENNQQQIAIRTVIAKLSDQINQNNFEEWIQFFANYEIVLIILEIIMRNILNQIHQTDRYLIDINQIDKQQIDQLSRYLALPLDSNNQVITTNLEITKHSLILWQLPARISINEQSGLSQLNANSIKKLKKQKSVVKIQEVEQPLECCCKFW